MMDDKTDIIEEGRADCRAPIFLPDTPAADSVQAADASSGLVKTAGFQPFLTPFSASYRRYTAYRCPYLGAVSPLSFPFSSFYFYPSGMGPPLPATASDPCLPLFRAGL